MTFLPDESLLIERMRLRAPVLVLGAGFSRGVNNKHNQPLPNAQELAEAIFTQVLSKNKRIDPSDLAHYENYRTDLKAICNACRMEDMVKKRDEYLVDQLSGCRCINTDYHQWLKLYPWRYIFTLNIDDLVEAIYQDCPVKNQPLVHRKNASTLDRNASLELFKLHGCVTRPDLGFVFDKDEYVKYITSPSWGLSSFANLFLTNDVIFLGTEFQEEDLQVMIQSNLNQVEINTAPHYFFISPQISNFELTRMIRKQKNLHHIMWDTKKFLSTIKSQITDINDIRRKMRDYGMVFYDEKLSESESESRRYLSKLYVGDIPRPLDFFQDYDIRRYETEKQADKLSSDGQHHLVTIYGDAYVGKTCSALRLGVDLMKKGYEFSVFSLSYTMHATSYRERVLEYLRFLPNGTKVAILAENMPYYYGHIKMILENCPANINSLIYICTASTQDHHSKKYLLDCYSNLEEIHLTEKTSDGRIANNIYDKLSEKHHLNKLRSYSSTRKECVQYIKSINDLIEVLYIAQEGRYFVTYFSDLLANKANDADKNAFLILSCFSALDISEISIMLFANIVKQCGLSFDMKTFRKEYADIIRIQGDRITVRCSRLLWNSCEHQLTENRILTWIKSAVRYLGQILTEREESLQNEVFQKLLKVKHLRSRLHFSNQTILELLISVSAYCKHLSYYWVQRGIIHRDMEDFEEANNALSEAASIRQNISYHILHAQAKNYMTWGVWAVKNEPSHAAYYFDLGKKQITELISIVSPRFYAYSIHTYIDMTIRYYQTNQLQIPESEIQTILHMLLQLSDRMADKLVYSVAKVFLNYCASINYHDIGLKELSSRVATFNTPNMSSTVFESLDVDELTDDGEI